MVLHQVKRLADELVRFLLFYKFRLYELCTVNQIHKQ